MKMFIALWTQADYKDIPEEISFWKDPIFKRLKMELSI